MKTALIIGIRDKNGLNLAKHLIQKNYKVSGVSRSKFNNRNIIKLKISKDLKMYYFDYCNKNKIQNLLKKQNFNEIYFFAGQTVPRISNKISLNTLNANIIPVFNILLTIHNFKLKSKFFNAFSYAVFGINQIKVSEKMIKKPVSVYGLSKLVSLELVKFFKEKFNLKCYSGIFFYHEPLLKNNNKLYKNLRIKPKNIIFNTIDKLIKNEF
tara:strand:- start:638 stop:1270 length:633 start_codon:yes stop_codon:yes gene_type:complete